MPYVYSTMTTPVAYQEHDKAVDGSIPRVTREVKIAGGAGLASKHLVTPLGVGTEVSTEDLAFLMQHSTFTQHLKAGWVVISERRHDEEEVAADMASRDRSAPLTPNDFEAEGKPVPRTDRTG